MNIDFNELRKQVIGNTIPRPLSGTLSGHAAGEPFDKHVYSALKDKYPGYTFRRYEYLNELFSMNPMIQRYVNRMNLLKSPTVSFLLSRGKSATDKWSRTNQFEEKQNDTADILVVKNDYYNLLDIKTRNMSKSSQPPNIISAYKLAQLCKKMIENGEYDNFSIDYFEIDWILESNFLKCTDAHHACLFKSDPEKLYINWAAAMQIQFHVCNVDQSFGGTRMDWANAYLEHFVYQAKKRADDMIEKFVKPFSKYPS
ncbi:HincII family type II restriction endonuclease [Bacteroides sp.]|uniref:HincII family type II restriction endonuclease n=1 Tax=Bacteroides sp. TaxID=29523 RepID=UPI002615E7CC|nr:HincII family type II restriction endonuclease [Bacteroides sp.]MDD3038528.1 HincII family type II restriction endonuclease [Bacteroides sp.]